ncbi:DNA binding domain-containing protein, excisionase family [Quadrisphaera granulorum]|uniref:Excisionase family DNA binding protein n=1 Tax=Quadrisphaera granulorum TaxID=317664 RepID=A0A316ARA9_9ACTN|nr:helix-turn-helix domain-containing protein [Quadrisphaera granulorum]PWJ52617.1 excisionase family DNA binding protein [Quadrisphaera granulorum]SZE97667.1 DNA binding domain-containing protein, excisionase family [Quadrisphaera granulorum]
MTDVLMRDADALHRALEGAGDEVKVSVSRATAEWLADIVDARSRGQRIVVTQGRAEVTPAEAAALLGVSRPQVRKFMDEGKLGFRMVGAHHRIPLESIEAFRAWEREQMTRGMEAVSQLQNELGLSH